MRLLLFFFISIYFILIPISLKSEILKPDPNIEPEEVISIQLMALMDNNNPYKDAGIEQTWEFAHPNNKSATGPLSNFTKMMYSEAYSIMLNHKNHKIMLIKKQNNVSYFFIELIDKYGNEFGFQWIVKKVITNDKLFNCWMTIGVSQPIKLSKST